MWLWPFKLDPGESIVQRETPSSKNLIIYLFLELSDCHIVILQELHVFGEVMLSAARHLQYPHQGLPTAHTLPAGPGATRGEVSGNIFVNWRHFASILLIAGKDLLWFDWIISVVFFTPHPCCVITGIFKRRVTSIREIITTDLGVERFISDVHSSPVFLFLLILTLHCFTSTISWIQKSTKKTKSASEELRERKSHETNSQAE